VLCGTLKAITVVSAAETVQLAIAGGRVTLVARGATLQQIFAEWARVGGTRIDNAETIPATTVDLNFTDATEDEALQVLLRGMNFVLVERPQDAQPPAASRIARIVVAPAHRPLFSTWTTAAGLGLRSTTLGDQPMARGSARARDGNVH